MVLHVAGALHRVLVDDLLELAEQILVALADDVHQHVETSAVGHAQHRRVHVIGSGQREHLVEDRNGRLGPFQTKTLLAEKLRAEELFERIGLVEQVEDVDLLVAGQGEGFSALHLLLNPALLVHLLHVHELDADGSAVRVAQHPEDLAEGQAILAADAGVDAPRTGLKLAVEVPDGEAVGDRVEFLVDLGDLGRQRIEFGDEVAAAAVHVDQHGDAHLLLDEPAQVIGGVGVLTPLHRNVRHADVGEYASVKVLLAQQQSLDGSEERAGFGALDYPVVVGGGEGQHLGDAQVGDRFGVCALIGGGVGKLAHPHDHRLSRHQPGHRQHRTDRARVGQADQRTLEVIDGQLVGHRAVDHVAIGVDELAEVHRLGALDHRHHQQALATTFHIDGQPHADVAVAGHLRLRVVVPAEGHCHVRVMVGDGPHDGVADDVREADLATAGAAQVPVDDPAVDLEQLCRNIANRGGGRNPERGLHVLGDRSADAPDGLGLTVGRRRLWWRLLWGGLLWWRCLLGRRYLLGRSRFWGRLLLGSLISDRCVLL